MVYTSIPPYIDPPNWNQHQGVHQGGGSGDQAESHQPPPSMVPRSESGRIGVARPGSMAEIARQAKIPQPEQPLNCPRCDSTNTKFCYFNNYSLSQPRHFCKTCRRYWTRGGALRNVPVGGGCRRNKRTKSSNSKNLTNNDAKSGGSMAINYSTLPINRGGAIRSSISGPPSLPFLGSLHPFSDYGSGLNFTGIQSVDPANYQIGSSSGGGGLDQWRMEQVQQFPFFTNVDQPSMLPPTTIPMYQFETEPAGFAGNVHGKMSGSGLLSQLSSINMEENSHGMNLSRQNLGMPGNVGYWDSNGDGGGGGNGNGNGNGSSSGMRNTDLSVFSSSTTNNFL